MRFITIILLIFFLAAETFCISLSADHNEPDSIIRRNLSEVTVSGSRSESLIMINAVTMRASEIEEVNTENFINMVEQLPGIMKIHEATFPLIIRGMYGSRIHVEKNGIIKTGISQTGYSLEDINPSDVSEVSLIHGSRNIIFGSGSIGGVLLINEKVDFSKKGFNARLKTSFATNNNENSYNLRLGYTGAKDLINITGRYTKASDLHYSHKEKTENSSYEYKNLSSKYVRLFPALNMTLSWDNAYYSGKRDKPLGFQNNPYDFRSLNDRYNFESSLKLKVNGTTSIFNGNVWYNTLNTDQSQDQYNAGTKKLAFREIRQSYKNSAGARADMTFNFIKNWTLQSGCDIFYDDLRQDKEYEDIIRDTRSFYKDFSGQRQNIYGLFLFSEYESQKHKIGISLRGDIGRIHKDSITSDLYKNITGGIDWDYTIRKYLISRFSVSRHFRFPIPMEAVGVFYGGRGTFVGNPDINPETSYNIEYKLSYSGRCLLMTANFWTSLFFDRINEQEIFTNKYTYINIDKARLYGFEGSLNLFCGKVRTTGKADLLITAHYAYGDDVSEKGFFSKGTYLEGIPPGRISSRLKYTIRVKGIETYASGRFSYIASYDRLPEEAVTNTWGQNARNAYPFWDAGAGIKFCTLFNGINLDFTVNNMLDRSYQPYGGYLKGMGRNFKTTLSFNF